MGRRRLQSEALPAKAGRGSIGRRRAWPAWSRAAVAALATLMIGAAPGQPDCFRREDNLGLKYTVIQVANPPPYSAAARDYVETSPYYPGSLYASGLRGVVERSGPSASGVRFDRYYLQWVNRCLFLPGVTPTPGACRNTNRSKGNGYPAMPGESLKTQVRPVFSTYEKANTCTLIQIERVLGEPDASLEASAHRVGLTLDANSNPQAIQARGRNVQLANGQNAAYLVDECVLDSSPGGPNLAGVMLDFEAWDLRTPEETVDFVRKVRAVTSRHGVKLGILTDPLPRELNGMAASSVHGILAQVDVFAPAVATGASAGNAAMEVLRRQRQVDPATNFESQVAVFGGLGSLTKAERAKIVWQVGLYDISVDEAAELRRRIVRDGFAGVGIAREYVREGGACSLPQNQVIACLTLGACDGRFGLDRTRP